jgi:hypothetical protein
MRRVPRILLNTLTVLSLLLFAATVALWVRSYRTADQLWPKGRILITALAAASFALCLATALLSLTARRDIREAECQRAGPDPRGWRVRGYYATALLGSVDFAVSDSTATTDDEAREFARLFPSGTRFRWMRAGSGYFASNRPPAFARSSHGPSPPLTPMISLSTRFQHAGMSLSITGGVSADRSGSVPRRT